MLFAGTGRGVFRSTNNGASWAAATDGQDDVVFSLAIIGTDIYAGTDERGVFRSVDDGASWTEVNSGLTNSIILSLAVSDTTLFAGTGGGGVFRSIDGGSSWSFRQQGPDEH